MKNISWFLRRQLRTPESRLYCFPYAGGNASAFNGWQDALPAFEICAIQLPGRAARYNEKSITSFSTLVSAISEAIAADYKVPFGFFGHSWGAILSLEVARSLKYKFQLQPRILFASGCNAPTDFNVKNNVQNMTNDELIGELRNLQGVPEDVLQNNELMELILPATRADFIMAENYIYKSGRKIDCPISVISGMNDESVAPQNLTHWSVETSSTVEVKLFNGGHFFINTENVEVFRFIKLKEKIFQF
jgi:surfactin synthase thioesterase subunit